MKQSISLLTRLHCLVALVYAALFPAAPPPAGAADLLTPREIMDKVSARPRGNNVAAELRMTLIGAAGERRTRKMRSFKRDQDGVIESLIFFVEPADVRDTGFLVRDYRLPGRDNEQWIFLPSLHKVKRIATAGKSGSFMGSDLSYSDLASRVAADYSYSLLKDSEVRSHPVWVIEAIPKGNPVIERTGYTKSLLLVRKDNFVVVGAVHWLKSDNSLKYVEVTRLEQRGGFWVPMELRARSVRDKKTVHQTLLRTLSIRFGQTFPSDFFTPRSLERGL